MFQFNFKRLSTVISSWLSSARATTSNTHEIFTVYGLLYLILLLFNSYEIYVLAGMTINLLENLIGYDVNGVGQFLVIIFDSYPHTLKSKRTLLLLKYSVSRFPAILLTCFICLISFHFALTENFGFLNHLFVGCGHFLLHKSIHFMEHDKQRQWNQCRNYVNKCKRFLKKKSHPPKNVSHEKE